jgi:hypothetical protein
MRSVWWAVVLAVIAALGPTIPAQSRQLSLDAPLGRALYIGAILAAAFMMLWTNAREEKQRRVADAARDANDAKRDRMLAAILEAKSPAELNAKVEELRAEIEDRDSEADGIFR